LVATDWRRFFFFFFFFFLVPWRIDFEGILCHFWRFVKLQKSHSRSSWINYMSLSSP
jgi:hypothetical protein